jgi:hypothetical protein
MDRDAVPAKPNRAPSCVAAPETRPVALDVRA